MAPRVKVLFFLTLFVGAVTSTAPCLAAGDPVFAPLQKGATDDAIGQMYGIFGRTRCSRSACVAISDLYDIEQELGQRDTPNGTTLADPSKFNPRTYDRRVDRLLALKKSRHAALCDTLAVLLRHYVDVNGERSGLWALEIASRIDSSDRPGCLAEAMAAVPTGPAGDNLLKYIKGRCLNRVWVGADRHRSCNRFDR